MSAFDPDDLARRFRHRDIPHNEWTHQAHLIVGLWHVHRYEAHAALEQLRTGIRALNDSHGTVNSDDSGYHETITRAYVCLLSHFIRSMPRGLSVDECAKRLLTSELAHSGLLLHYYTKGHLMSKRARGEWVEPDLCPLPELV